MTSKCTHPHHAASHTGGPSLTRRAFIGGVGAVAGVGSLGLTFKRAKAGQPTRTLVYIFLRGGMDGLSLVVPSGTAGASNPDKQIYDGLRNQTRISSSDSNPDRRPLALGSSAHGIYGLHPYAGGLKQLYDMGDMAVIQAAGHPLNALTRSHFDAEEQIELGTPGSQTLQIGWLTRHLETTPLLASDAIFTAMVSSSNPPTSLGGWPDVATLDSPNSFHPNNGTFGDTHLAELASLYNGTGSLDAAALAAVGAVDLISSIDLDDYVPGGGVTYPNNGLGNDLKLIAQLIDQDLGIAVATADYGGWDTHNQQNVFGGGGSYGGRVEELSNAVNAFFRDLKAKGRGDDVAIVIQSEFGRQVQENANAGTDHGLGNPMFVIGGRCNGGQILQDAPLLTQLQAGDAVRPRYDFRDVLGTVVERMMGNPNVDQVFPDDGEYSYSPLPFA